MTWIILEGLDRTGKSTVAAMYAKKGYEVVHYTAPDKKYLQPGYAGPSYLDECLEIYMKYDGVDVVFDRSPYGELVWPQVYNRKAQLSIDDESFSVLEEYEQRNSVQKIVMQDPNEVAHWKRCVDNKEPMDHNQFKLARLIFNNVARQHGFAIHQLADFKSDIEDAAKAETKTDVKEQLISNPSDSPASDMAAANKPVVSKEEEQRLKLEKANALNYLLSKRLIKQQGEPYDSIERDMRAFLTDKLAHIFGSSPVEGLTVEEVQILKLMAQRVKSKQGAGA